MSLGATLPPICITLSEERMLDGHSSKENDPESTRQFHWDVDAIAWSHRSESRETQELTAFPLCLDRRPNHGQLGYHCQHDELRCPVHGLSYHWKIIKSSTSTMVMQHKDLGMSNVRKASICTTHQYSGYRHVTHQCHLVGIASLHHCILWHCIASQHLGVLVHVHNVGGIDCSGCVPHED